MSDGFLLRGGLAVVDSGTDAEWTWYKLSNGVAICYGTLAFGVAITNPWGSVYSSADKPGSYNYPEGLFVSTPVSVMSLDYSGLNCWLVTSTRATKDHTQGVQFVRPTSEAMTYGQLFNLSIGRWKA